MSKYIRGSKRPINPQHQPNNNQKNEPLNASIRAAVRSPLSHAAVGLASMMLATTGTAAQEAGTAAQQRSGATTGQQSSTTLPQINVRSGKRKQRARPVQAVRSTPPVASSAAPAADRSYQASTNSSLTRVPTALRDTPQTVNVVTQAVIRDQNVSDVKDALRNVAGVTFRAGEGGNQGDTPYIRGFSAQNDIFRDGIRDPGWYTRDSFPIDSIEVYKGPSSVLFGRGSTGGAINLVSKLPTEKAFVEGTISGNTAPGVRATVDANGKINENVSARIVVMGQRYDIADRDNVETNRWGVAPSIKVKINNQTTNTLSYIYQHDTSVPDYGIPFLGIGWGNPRPILPVPRNTWYGILGGPYPDTETVDAHILTNKFEHEFNKDVKVVNTTRYSNVDHFQRNVFPQGGAGALALPAAPVDLTNRQWQPNRRQVGLTNSMASNTTDLIAKFNTGFLEHTTITGVEFNHETRDQITQQFAGQGATSLLNPSPYRANGTPGTPTYSEGRATDIAIYAADQVKINRYFEVLGSIRLERFKFEQTQPTSLGRTDDLVSWRVGGVFHPTLNSSIYVMHGTSFNPSADNLTINAATVGLSPEKNVTTEGGVKVDLFDNKLSLASAIFHTEKTNLRVPNPIDNTVNILGGVVEGDGFEASASGYITKQWQIIASYTYVHARVTQTTTPSQLNTEPVNTATHSFSLWTTYDITPKWQVGGGVFYGGEVYGDAGSAATPQSALVPDWWRFDLMAAYKISPKATLQLNIYNVTDTLYYQSAYSNWVVPASGRMASMALRVKY
jgi:catecholate siderophore receptor